MDYQVGNHSVSTWPRSPFVTAPRVQRTGPGLFHGLNGTTLTATTPDGSQQERQLTSKEVPEALEAVFGIVLDADDAARLIARLEHQPAAAEHP